MSDALFGIHAKALSLGRARMDVLAANIANADTPHYLAKDVDFAQALKSQTTGTGALHATNAQHLALGGSGSAAGAQEVWRVPLQPSADGNTVDVQIEQSQFAEAALKYQASLNFLDGRVRALMTAITGQ
ncbi:MAG: flagellar basal body rod protein FlgB [Stagnimonas sp.]|nr:flagellar basal body rod protein FlgB [Stagnimonas sp.]